MTFSGIDGAGKTTLIRAFTHELHRRGVSVVVLTMYDDVSAYSLARRLRGLIDRRTSTERRSSTTAGTSFVYRFFRCPAVRLASLLGDLAMLWLLRWYHERLRRRVLVLDRYLYDSLVEVAAARTGARIPSALLRLVPKPTIPVLVDIDPAIAFGRKGEYSIEELTLRRALYRDAFSTIRDAVVIHNDEASDAHSVISEIASRALR